MQKHLSDILQNKNLAYKKQFNPGFLQRPLTIFQFRFKAEASFYLKISGDRFNFAAGLHNNRTIMLDISDHATCWGLLEGSIDGMEAFMAGNYRADGNIILSQILLYLFKHNDTSTAPNDNT